MSADRLLLVALVAASLSGCGTMNSWLARNTGDVMPHWAGGLPADAPPRPGTAEYEEYKKRLEGRPEQMRDEGPPPNSETRSARAIY
jgi:hypothetical protein